MIIAIIVTIAIELLKVKITGGADDTAEDNYTYIGKEII